MPTATIVHLCIRLSLGGISVLTTISTCSYPLSLSLRLADLHHRWAIGERSDGSYMRSGLSVVKPERPRKVFKRRVDIYHQGATTKDTSPIVAMTRTKHTNYCPTWRLRTANQPIEVSMAWNTTHLLPWPTSRRRGVRLIPRPRI